MAINITLSEGSPQAFAVGNQTMNYVVSIENTGASALTLLSLVTGEDTKTGAIVSQPVYLTTNVPVGVGNPVIAAGATVNYGFQLVCTQPTMPGPSPQAPGGAAPTNAAYYPLADRIFRATSVMSDGTVSSATIVAPVLTATFPQSNGGALVMSQGFNLVNLVTL